MTASVHWTEAVGEHRWLARRRSPIPAYVGDLKVCRKCERALPVDAFGRYARALDGLSIYCLSCQRARFASYRYGDHDGSLDRERLRDARRAQRGRVTKPYAEWSPEAKAKQAARMRLLRAVRKGTVIKPSQCSGCDRETTLHAHHPRGYDGPAALDVEWLCSRCHGKAHRT